MAASQCSAAGYRCHLQHLADPSKESTPDRRRPLRNGWRHIPDTPIAFIHRFHPSLGNASHACYDREHCESSPTSDPTSPAGCSYCVLRGGCDGPVAACRPAFCNNHLASFRAPFVEFSMGLAPSSHAINVLNGWVIRFADTFRWQTGGPVLSGR